MSISTILCGEISKRLDISLAIELFSTAPLSYLMARADARRRELHPEQVVTYQIDRNVNITNVCVSGCKFCNFHCRLADTSRAYITTMDEYRAKIDQMLALGGDQLLLQGGLHPRLGLEWYEDLFRALKSEYPSVKLHALGPPEVAHLARLAGGVSYSEVLRRLIAAGLESLPGAGAEILDNEVRARLSPGKCSADVWVEVMHEAHLLGLNTSATMMYGHVETVEQRMAHLFTIRDLQDRRPEGSVGFRAFIPWPYRGSGTPLAAAGFAGDSGMAEFLRTVAISRLVLDNIDNIQASWLTTGVGAGQMALHGGANDMGSIMIEENVVSSVGSRNVLDRVGMERAIREAGFSPALRDQAYNLR